MKEWNGVRLEAKCSQSEDVLCVRRFEWRSRVALFEDFPRLSIKSPFAYSFKVQGIECDMTTGKLLVLKIGRRRRTKKTAPLRALLRTCSCMFAPTIASPSPAPPIFPVRLSWRCRNRRISARPRITLVTSRFATKYTHQSFLKNVSSPVSFAIKGSWGSLASRKQMFAFS